MRLLFVAAILIFLVGLFYVGVLTGRSSKNRALNEQQDKFEDVLTHARALTQLNPVAESQQYVLQNNFLSIALDEYVAYRQKELFG